MNEYKHFKDSLGMDDDFELHTWANINKLWTKWNSHELHEQFVNITKLHTIFTIHIISIHNYYITLR